MARPEENSAAGAAAALGAGIPSGRVPTNAAIVSAMTVKAAMA